MKTIKSAKEYEKLFENKGDSPEKDVKVNLTLQQAIDIRKFEIDLYWKRTAYCWAFIVLIFASFYAIEKDKIENYYQTKFLLSLIGLVFSVAWYHVNKGSKYWQMNWEKHVSLLEDYDIGPLFKTVLSENQFRSLGFWKSKLSA
ncbi:MAG: hypothetical protein ABI550_08495 [Ignavibacteriaceae bacterium]